MKSALALVALAALILEPGASFAAGQAADRVQLRGRLVVLHEDDFTSDTEAERYAVQLADGTMVEANFSNSARADQLVGQDVEVVADAQGGSYVAPRTSGTSDATAAPATAHQTAVLLLNFTNDTSQPWTTESVTNTVFGASGSVAAYYREVSNGLGSLEGTVVGWLTVPYDNSGCRYSTWSNAATSASGVDLSKYQHVVFAFPRTTCTWAGLSTIGGKYSWINGAMTIRTVGHELAHQMGVHHASALNCTSNGVRVSYSPTCTRLEYGDPFSIMGTGVRHLTNLALAQIGWLTEIRTVTTSGVYSIAPADLTAPPRLLRVPRGNGTYLYFELRQDYGAYDVFPLNAPATRGVTIRIAPDVSSRVQSQLIDTTPSTLQFDDAPLTVGRSFTDPVSFVTITTTAASSGGATIALSWQGAAVVAPSPTPTPTPSASHTPSPAPTATAPATPGPTPSATATATVPASPAATATTTPSPTPTASPAQLTTLTAPSNLHAYRTWARRVRVTWTASAGPVAGYSVWRNGTWLGRTTSLRFIDHVPAGVRKATYVVRAFDLDRNRGPRAWYTLSLR